MPSHEFCHRFSNHLAARQGTSDRHLFDAFHDAGRQANGYDGIHWCGVHSLRQEPVESQQLVSVELGESLKVGVGEYEGHSGIYAALPLRT
jgi:hypothetical protein